MADEDNTTKGKRLKTRVNYPRIELVIDAATILDAERCKVRTCFISLAIMRAYPDLVNVEVDVLHIRATWMPYKLRCIWETPRIAGISLFEFDGGLHPNPFLLKPGKPLKMFRTRGPDLNLSKEERKVRDAARKREYRRARGIMMDQTSGRFSDEQKEIAATVVANMQKPDRPLGPSVALRAKKAGNDNRSIIIGGASQPVLTHGIYLKTRRFGLREMQE